MKVDHIGTGVWWKRSPVEKLMSLPTTLRHESEMSQHRNRGANAQTVHSTPPHAAKLHLRSQSTRMADVAVAGLNGDQPPLAMGVCVDEKSRTVNGRASQSIQEGGWRVGKQDEGAVVGDDGGRRNARCTMGCTMSVRDTKRTSTIVGVVWMRMRQEREAGTMESCAPRWIQKQPVAKIASISKPGVGASPICRMMWAEASR
ncbi:hypothetical protein R3P38DRAFT_2765149 [Favolaschia claudopus]|uniref:Uncharacterized protein n=1 Tax=Favolaschia claudopus TaxID=2862362 RepID=A0AAW0D191_9AGAR